MRWRDWGPVSRAALLLCAAAAALAVWSGFDAWRLDAAPAPIAPDPSAFTMPRVRSASRALPPDVVLRTVGLDPFRPDRRPAAQRYRLPGEAPPPTAPSVAGWRLLGTASYADGGGIAAITMGSASRVYHVGDMIGELQLIRVTPGTAVLQWRDSTITLSTTEPGGTS
jgi:hypothetical protein